MTSLSLLRVSVAARSRVIRQGSQALISVLIALTAATCGGGGGTPSSPTPVTANVSASFLRLSGGQQPGGGFVYEAVLQVRETGGVAVTITGIDLTFFDGTSPFGTTHFDSPMASSNEVPANGTGTSKVLTSTDDSSSGPFATRVQAVVRYTDVRATQGSASTTGDLPALSAAPPPQTFSLSGTVLEAPGGRRVSGALVEIKTGANAGAALLSDASGRFSFGSLVTGTFTVAVSKSQYDTLQQAVTLSSNATITLNVRRSSAPPLPGPEPSLCAPATASCGQATARCNDGTLSCSQNRQGTCSSHDGVRCFICPGLLCNGLTDAPLFTPALPYTPAQSIIR